MDMEDSSGEAVAHVPTFNTLCAFRVPRWHAVTPLAAPPHGASASAAPRRLSLFGWFLQPGELYELDTGMNGSASGEEEEEG